MILRIQRLIRALFLWLTGARRRLPKQPVPAPSAEEPQWLSLARQDLGIREYEGASANPQIMRAWSHVEYDPPHGDETAWCSAKLCEWFERSGQPSTRAPNARSWLKWGHEVVDPKPGCVAIFWRGSPRSWQGHVGLYLGRGDQPGTVKVLGGNQGDSVSIADYSEAQLLGFRWPTTPGNSRTLKAQTAGIMGDGLTLAGLSGALIETLPDMLAISEGMKALGSYWPWCTVIGICISLAARAVTIWARLNDWQEKGV